MTYLIKLFIILFIRAHTLPSLRSAPCSKLTLFIAIETFSQLFDDITGQWWVGGSIGGIQAKLNSLRSSSMLPPSGPLQGTRERRTWVSFYHKLCQGSISLQRSSMEKLAPTPAPQPPRPERTRVEKRGEPGNRMARSVPRFRLGLP